MSYDVILHRNFLNLSAIVKIFFHFSCSKDKICERWLFLIGMLRSLTVSNVTCNDKTSCRD